MLFTWHWVGRQTGHLLLILAALVQGKLWQIICFHSFLFHPLLPDLQQHTHKHICFGFPLCFVSPPSPHLLYPKQNQEVRGTNILLANQKKIHLLFFSSISLDQPVPVLNSLPFSTATVYDHGWSWCYILYHNFNRKFDYISLPVILKHCYPPPIYLSALLLHRDVGPSASSSLLSSKSDTICPCTFIPVTPKPSYQLRKERYANISKCKLSIWHMFDWFMI